METKIVVSSDSKGLANAAEVLAKGGLVAFPTETVYGLGANALDGNAVNSIFKAKGRPSDNPLIVHISDIDVVKSLVQEIPDFAKTLMESFWPGPLTLVMKKSSLVPDEVSAGLDTVGIRMPAHPVALKIIELAGVPIAAPSANLSGKPSPTNFTDVKEDLNGKVDFIIDGGVSEIGVESTVLDVTVFPPVILRPGGITPEQIQEKIGSVLIHKSIAKLDAAATEHISYNTDIPKSPGMKYTHYSPKAELKLVVGLPYSIALTILPMANEKNIGVMATQQTLPFYFDPRFNVKLVGDRQKPETIASNIFALMREFDREGVNQIFAEGIESTEVGLAVMNRLKKAATGQPIQANSHNLKLLFICTGNTCRSSMAEAIMNKLAKDKNLNIEVMSAGVAASNGEPASQHAITAMQQLYSTDMTAHQATRITYDLLDNADLVLTMEPRHAHVLHENVPELAYKITTLPMFSGDPNIGGISDPYGGSLNDYIHCAKQLMSLLQQVAQILVRSGLNNSGFSVN